MRHVPIAEFKDRVSEFIAAAQNGDEIIVTKHGRATVKLVPVETDRREEQRAIIEEMFGLGQEIKAKFGPTTAAEIRQWIDEDRP